MANTKNIRKIAPTQGNGKGSVNNQASPGPSKSARKRQRRKARQAGMGGGPNHSGKATGPPDSFILPVRARLTAPLAANNKALAINFMPSELREETVLSSGVNDSSAGYPSTSLIQQGNWLRTLGALFAKCRWVNLVVEWIPLASVTTEGEVVLGHLADATDVFHGSKSNVGGTHGLVDDWNGRPEEVEILSSSASGPIREVLRMPIRCSKEWSKIDPTVTLTQKRQRAAAGDDWDYTVEEGALHFLKDGIALAHFQGMSKVSGDQSTVADYGHFRVTGNLELSGRNGFAGTTVAGVEPSFVVKRESVLEPVRLSLDDLHHLEIDHQLRISRNGTEKVTSPFGGVSISDGGTGLSGAPLHKATIQYDPDRSGWSCALLALGPGVRYCPEGTTGLKIRAFPSGLLVESVSAGSRLVLSWTEGHTFMCASRPCQGPV